jgi:hypothetical protein
MPVWLLWLLPSYEAGFYSAVVAVKIRNRGKVRELLLHGKRPRTTLPFIDERLRIAAGTTTKSQEFIARHSVVLIRWLANTRAIEYALLIALKRSWPKGQAIASTIRLCL